MAKLGFLILSVGVPQTQKNLIGSRAALKGRSPLVRSRYYVPKVTRKIEPLIEKRSLTPSGAPSLIRRASTHVGINVVNFEDKKFERDFGGAVLR